MCFRSAISLSEFMLVLTILFTGGLLRVAWLAYKRLLVQEASKKQLEIVNHLINDIVYSGIKIYTHNFIGPSQIAIIDTLNIFSYSQFDFVAENQNYDVIMSKDIYNKELNEVIHHLGNPLLPPSIAESINALRKIAIWEVVNVNQNKESFYVLGSDIIDFDKLTTLSQVKVSRGINGWIQACKNIQAAITNWYHSKGVKEINHLALASNNQ